MTIATLLVAALTVAQVPAPTAPITPGDAPRSVPPQRALQRRADVLGTTGAAALIVSAGFWTFMVAAMLGGRRKADRYNTLVDEVNAIPRPLDADERRWLDSIRRNGQADNRLAIAGGVTAGVLTVIGAALLGRAAVLRRHARDLRPLVLPRGVGVGWHVRF